MKVLLLDNWGERAREVLGEALWVPRTGTEVAIMSQNKNFGVVGIIASLENRISRDTIDNYTSLKFIASCTTGLDHIDTEYCKAKGIKIISLQGETDFLQDVYATAEHTWALILSLIRKVPFAFEDVKQGNWNREAWQGAELRGKTLGIVGYGRVGRQVARIAEAFGMGIIAYDPQLGGNPYRKEDLQCVLQNSDIITVHVPLNEETKGMFGIEQFKQMKKSALFINTSRGQIVNTYDLVHALRKGVISGAALDVLDGEPEVRITRELIEDLGNLIITPHLGGQTAESREKTQLFIVDKIKQFIQGGG